MSKQVVLQSLSKRFHFIPTTSLSSNAGPHSAPRLIILFAWMGARLSHAQKYVNGYHAIWPATPIILVQSLPSDFRPLSRYAKEYTALVSLIAQHNIDLTNPDDGKHVLIATMSNGGCGGIDALLRCLPQEAVLRPRALILDSCPGIARYSATLRAFLIAGKYRLFSKAIASVVITLYYCLSVFFNKISGRDPLGRMRTALIERVIAQRRAYIYSQEDNLIYWKDVEKHSEQAQKARHETKLEMFNNSPHVMHIRSDEVRYWKIIQQTWDPASFDLEVKAPEPIASDSGSVEKDTSESTSEELNVSYVEAIPPVAISQSSQLDTNADNVETSIEPDSADSSEDLTPSILGTKEYWEDIYRRERANYAENQDDEGEIWFGEEAEYKIVSYLEHNHPQDQKLQVLDLGTGNGHLLFKLFEEGFVKWDMVGVDYSEHSIELARAIARTRKAKNIQFRVEDFLDEQAGSSDSKFDIVIDKGTFDAISLSDQRTASGKKLNEIYAASVARYMKPGAKLLITSCNWTTEELIQRLTADKVLKVHQYFRKPKQFSFGGSTGTTTSSVCFALAE